MFSAEKNIITGQHKTRRIPQGLQKNTEEKSKDSERISEGSREGFRRIPGMISKGFRVDSRRIPELHNSEGSRRDSQRVPEEFLAFFKAFR